MNDISAIRWVFFLQPVILGAWFPRIPQVQAALELSAGQLAFALIGMPIGLLTALGLGARLAEALGTRRLLLVGMLAQGLMLPVPGYASTGPMLFAMLALAGVALAAAQLSLNVTASVIEVHSGRLIMNGCHGFWSIGVLLGSAVGVLCAAYGIAPGHALTATAAIVTPPLILIAYRITDHAVPAPPREAAKGRAISRPLALIALFAFGIAMAEGAMADWAAVYLTDVFAALPGTAGAGYTAFALFVATGRFIGDPLKARIPVDRLAAGFVAIALAGLAILVFGNSLAFAFVGISLLGLGVSLGFPLAVSAVSILPGRSSAANVALLTQMALCGFLVGPPIIGIIADSSSMQGGLAALAPALLVAFVLAGQLKPHAQGSMS